MKGMHFLKNIYREIAFYGTARTEVHRLRIDYWTFLVNYFKINEMIMAKKPIIIRYFMGNNFGL